jgi:Ala-tRNA(Pro) deacylase
MPVRQLKEYLDNNRIKYVTITHSVAYTTQEIASIAHVPGKELAKAVLVLMDNTLAMAVLPATRHIDLPKLGSAAGSKTIRLASEPEFRDRFPGCETGAMPPFGNLYNMPVYVDAMLELDKEIVFNAGTHVELMRLAYADYARLVKPKVAKFSSLGARVSAA